MSNNNTPDNWRNKVTKQSFSRFPEKKQNHERDIWIDGVHFGAIEKQVEYATKLHEAQQEITRLTNWQQEAKAILNPIWDYADTLNTPLGESKTEAVIKHIKDAKDLLTEVFRKHESGLLPDRFIYEKIKRFLHGE